jgi:hypothetical protein
VSIPYRIALRSGVPFSSAGRVQAPMPLTETPFTSCPSALLSSSETILVKSPHHTFSGSCSTKPGWGKSVSCGSSIVAITEPSGLASTPFEPEVPTSMPRSASAISNLHPSAGTCAWLPWFFPSSGG